MSFTSKDFVIDQLFDVVDADDLAANDEHLKDIFSVGHNWNATTPPNPQSHFMHIKHANFTGTIANNTSLSFSPGLYSIHTLFGTGIQTNAFFTHLENFGTRGAGGQQGYGTYKYPSDTQQSGGGGTTSGTYISFPNPFFSDGTNFKLFNNNPSSRMFFNCTVFKYNRAK